jgi:hypothetical protein
MAPLYEHENFGDVQRYVFMKGIITSVDSENDLADVTIPGGSDGTDIPIFYHCTDDAEERSNGAIEGGASAFSAGTDDDPTDGDEVIVMYDVEDNEAVRIIGFVDGIRPCSFRFTILRDPPGITDPERDDYTIITDAHEFVDDHIHFDYWSDWVWPFLPQIKIYNEDDVDVTIYYGDEDWWDEYSEDYFRGWRPPTDKYEKPENRPVLTYDEETHVWTCPLPQQYDEESFRTGLYRVMVGVDNSFGVQFYPPTADWVDDPPDYLYIFHTTENEGEYPYIAEMDDEEEYYLNTANPGVYDFYVPLWDLSGLDWQSVIQVGHFDCPDEFPDLSQAPLDQTTHVRTEDYFNATIGTSAIGQRTIYSSVPYTVQCMIGSRVMNWIGYGIGECRPGYDPVYSCPGFVNSIGNPGSQTISSSSGSVSASVATIDYSPGVYAPAIFGSVIDYPVNVEDETPDIQTVTFINTSGATFESTCNTYVYGDLTAPSTFDAVVMGLYYTRSGVTNNRLWDIDFHPKTT